MAFRITDECVSCGACAGVCSMGAIAEAEDDVYVIDNECCIECGACAALCPNDAIIEE